MTRGPSAAEQTDTCKTKQKIKQDACEDKKGEKGRAWQDEAFIEETVVKEALNTAEAGIISWIVL